MGISDKELKKYFGNLEDHEYRHYNNAMGIKVESKEHFKHLLDKSGFVPFDKAQQMVKESPKGKFKNWSPSDKLKVSLNRDLKNMPKDSKGNLIKSEGLVRLLKDNGVNFNPKFMTNDLKGGIDASK